MEQLISRFEALPFVRRVQIHEGVQANDQRVVRFPDGATSLLLRVAAEGATSLHVAGPRTGAWSKMLPPAHLLCHVEFGLGWAQLVLGVSPRELVDRVVPLDELWGTAAHKLSGQVSALAASRDCVAQLGAGLIEQAQRSRATGSAVLGRRAIRLVEQGRGRKPVHAIAAQLQITPRHLRRVFAELVGITPKEYSRMVRLQHALRSMQEGWSLARTASASGYYDHAHLVAEVRALTGLTPRQLAHTIGPGDTSCPPSELLTVSARPPYSK